MAKNIVVFSASDDIHAYALLKKAEEAGDTPARLIDNSCFPKEGMTVVWEGDCIVLELGDDDPVRISSDTSVWWRRPQPYSAPAEVSDGRLRRFVVRECAATVEGALCAAGCFMVNDIYNQRRADNKLLQLKVASDLGLRVPVTLVTNCNDRAQSFCNELSGRVIFKGQTSAFYHLGETRLVDEEVFSRKEQLRFAPVVFQQLIPCKHDIRVTVVGNALFATRIDSQSKYELIDWRLHQDVPMEPFRLPDCISTKCLQVTKALGLVYGAIDLRETPDGEVYFFEINSAGQFLFAEPDTSLPITKALYRTLAIGHV